MYSMDCQRVRTLIRFPTFTLPATAPTRASWKWRTISAMPWGAICVSASKHTRISPRASWIPRLRAAALPALGWLIRRTRGSLPNSASITAPVPSVEPSSTTTTSRPG